MDGKGTGGAGKTIPSCPKPSQLPGNQPDLLRTGLLLTGLSPPSVTVGSGGFREERGHLILI